MPKIDIAALPIDARTGYPPPHDKAVVGRSRKRLGAAAGLDQFGVNLTTLKPGAASTLRHWHENEDEFVYVLEGELALVEDEGETIMLVNRSDRDAVYLEIGTRAKRERAHYSDVDLAVVKDEAGLRYSRKDGTPL
ncbi:MAG: cupin domain-containing protein [Roseiarcus sp.]|uniref:cupin domain-containing protein n=1 Tax=Roseiarcus sp. TaxID=1969460 RepID=UPI003C139DCC